MSDGDNASSNASNANSNTNSNTANTGASVKTVKATEAARNYLKSLKGTYTVTASSLNVRNGAGVTKKKLVAIPEGTKVKCEGYYTKVLGVVWYSVWFNPIRKMV